jgi:cell division cycle 20-like protein 1 (cofactor of APC complex)
VIATEIQPKKKPRKINKFPYRVLDAPLLLNDYYLNLLDWSNLNQLGVGLARNVYLWDVNSLKTHQLFTVGERRYVTSVNFSPSNILAVGANDGTIELWDCNKNRCVHSYFGQQDRVGSLSWKNPTILASGSRDYSIMIRDTRAARPVIKTLNHHSEEVCGVKWSHDEQQLASGGIDNKLLIWEMHYPKPVFSI